MILGDGHITEPASESANAYAVTVPPRLRPWPLSPRAALYGDVQNTMVLGGKKPCALMYAEHVAAANLVDIHGPECCLEADVKASCRPHGL